MSRWALLAGDPDNAERIGLAALFNDVHDAAWAD